MYTRNITLIFFLGIFNNLMISYIFIRIGKLTLKQ